MRQIQGKLPLCSGMTVALVLFVSMLSTAATAETLLFYGTPGQAVVAQMTLDLQAAAASAAELTQTKRDFSSQIEDARGSVRASCALGARDAAAERRLVSLLQDKDFYYLPFYMQSGQAARAVAGLDAITGGQLDNGIRPAAQLSFASWALDMKAALGDASFRDQSALLSALQKSEAAYVQYVIFRDGAEIDEIMRGIDRPRANPAADALAGAYVNTILEPAIGDLKDITTADAAALRQWAEDVRAAIISYEKVEPTPEALAEYLRTKMNYPERALQIFLQRSNAAREQGKMNEEWLFREYHELRDEVDASRGSRPLSIPPRRDLEVLRMKWATNPEPVDHLDHLLDRDHLWRIKVLPSYNYVDMREWLINHKLGQSVDWCTGKPLK